MNPRASRTVPFVAKATDSAIASIAARLMAGEPLKLPDAPPHAPVSDDGDAAGRPDALGRPEHAVVLGQGGRAALRPLPRCRHDPRPRNALDRRSHGLGPLFARAFLKAQMGAGVDLPTSGTVFFSIKDDDKTDELIETARMLRELGLSILATRGTASFLTENGIPSDVVNKAYEGGRTIVDVMKDGEIAW